MPEEIRLTADFLGRRWVLTIVVAALSGAVRFNEFVSSIEGISPRMLAERLRDLEEAGLVERRVVAARPPLVEYRLTPRGRALGPVVEAIRVYAVRGRAARPARSAGPGDAAEPVR